MPERAGQAEPSVVKSVGRVFEVLEAFGEVRQPMTAIQVAKKLDYPTSSALALLKSMVALGYVSLDRSSRSYFPTVRLSILTQWVHSAVLGEGRLMDLMADLHATTGETVVLAIQNDLEVQYLHILPGTQPIMLNLPIGVRRPLCSSGMGWAILSAFSDDRVRKLAESVNARSVEAAVNIDALQETLVEVRTRGYASSYGTVLPGSGMIAIQLPGTTADRPVAIGLGGPVDRLRSREAELVGMMQQAITRHFKDAEPHPGI